MTYSEMEKAYTTISIERDELKEANYKLDMKNRRQEARIKELEAQLEDMRLQHQPRF